MMMWRRVITFVMAFVFISAAVVMAADNIDPITLEPTTPAKMHKQSPSVRANKDDPKLPRVLLIGDSISMGYTLQVRHLLRGKANVDRPTTNCGPTTKGLPNLDTWLGTENTGGAPARKWDVIHFNFGLHDLKYVDAHGRTVTPAEGHQNVPPAEYEKNLREIVERLKKTGASLIWATTTPVPTGLPGHFPDQVIKYNKIAARVMKEEGVPTDDLYSLMKPKMAEMQIKNNVHFHTAGSHLMAEQVVSSIEKALAERKASTK